MKIKTQIAGLERLQAELDDRVREAEGDTRRLVTTIMQGISANIIPYIPVDTSTLVNSETRRIVDQGEGEFVGWLQYGAEGVNPKSGTPVQEYAIYVHEGPQKNWQKPGASNRFVYKGFEDFLRDDLAAILRALK